MSSQPEMTFVDHLHELRKRIMRAVIVLVLTMVVGLILAKPIITYLKGVEPASQINWNVFSPWDSLRIYMNVSFLFAFLVSLPYLLIELWGFTKPALKKHEQSATIGYIPAAVLLGLVGLAFAYFIVFPMAFYFSTTVTDSLDLTETYGISQYFSFMFNILIPITLLFELPIVILFLTKIRILNPFLLKRFRRLAYLIMVVTGALITPPDMISAVVVSLPLILLYELSVWISRRVYRKLEEQDREREKAAEEMDESQ
ncbi:twin-arginine translocase subunit TatC [Marinicrinis sediminis]|uniref:Sec-independent protein translocase protein TatC n=1 Tax=Marinicrinis sediminis TaxID=1652465 RepID=A0ABW5R741_9BACL